MSILHSSGGIVGVTTWLHAGVSSIEPAPRGLKKNLFNVAFN